VEGIYFLDRDTLKICYARPGNPRPKAFDTRHGDKELQFTMKRVKP
jgi:hypothetical protein